MSKSSIPDRLATLERVVARLDATIVVLLAKANHDDTKHHLTSTSAALRNHAEQARAAYSDALLNFHRAVQ